MDKRDIGGFDPVPSVKEGFCHLIRTPRINMIYVDENAGNNVLHKRKSYGNMQIILGSLQMH